MIAKGIPDTVNSMKAIEREQIGNKATAKQRWYIAGLIYNAALDGDLDVMELKSLDKADMAMNWLTFIDKDEASTLIDSLLKKNYDISKIILKKHSIL